MEITPLTRKIVHIDLNATLAGGEPVTDITGILVALVPPRADVDKSTQWVAAATWDAAQQRGTALVVGYEADPEGALVVPELGADLYARVVDTPEDDPSFIERITYG